MSDFDKSAKDLQEEATFEGRVEILGDFPREKLEDLSGMKRMVKHSGLFLKTDHGRIVIHLGPAAYFLHHNFQIRAGDTLKVTGFPVDQGSLPLVQAREIWTQDRKLKLRDKNGQPLWPAAMDRPN
ncbi:MAG: hypothetical protein ACOC6L_03730 [Thermodesulfobacteriota bacterium]